MRLSSLFTQGNQVHMENGNTMDASARDQSLQNGLKQVSGKMPGETVTGAIVEKNGNDVLIAIGKNEMLQAKLDGSIQIDIGQQLTFTIKSTMGNKVTLSPLFTNMANDPNVAKALQMAGIPENETSVKMVKTMMLEGMSIDKNSLQQMTRTVNLNPQANIETLVQLTRLQIPVTEQSIFQFEAYKNYEHQMSEGILTIADSMPETLQSMAEEGNLAEGIALYKEVISLLGEQSIAPTEENVQSNVQSVFPDSQLMTMPQGVQETITSVLNEGANVQNIALGEAVVTQLGLSREETLALADSLKQAGFTQLSEAVVNNQIDRQTFLGELGRLLLAENLPPEVIEQTGKLLESREFNKLLKQEMKNQWMLAPEDVAEENKVENLYERLNSHMNRLNSVVEQMASQSPFAKAVTNMTGNIDFMNQLNQLFTYVQIPLKLQGNEANSELYVYTNKKNLAKEDGEVSALLHLDMEHLGSVDVHVSMKEQKVATQFYLQDDSALDLIEDNIEILNERLEKRGYQLNATFIHKDNEQNVIEEILDQDREISISSGYSFDARA